MFFWKSNNRGNALKSKEMFYSFWYNFFNSFNMASDFSVLHKAENNFNSFSNHSITTSSSQTILTEQAQHPLED